ncbi:hypothetical protein ACEPPN_019521 [Leptodophora sp. 'Broadleaf-Isolate-01']
MDPVGAAIGLTSVIVAFKGVVDTLNLFDLIVTRDNGSRHLALRYYIERRKLVIWGDEQKIDDELSSPLLQETKSTRTLIAGILAELRATHELAEKYIGRYDMEEPTPRGDETVSFSTLATNIKELRDLKKQKSRFRWATTDKQKFTDLIERMSSLNADLVTLVHTDSTQYLANALSFYLLPQLKDMLSLAALQHNDMAADPLVKLSARLKQLQTSPIEEVANCAAYLNLEDFESLGTMQSSNRSYGFLKTTGELGVAAWIEWKVVGSDIASEEHEKICLRIQALGSLLSTAQGAEFRIPPYAGLVEDKQVRDESASKNQKFGFVFTWPSPSPARGSRPKSLLELFETQQPPLEHRFEMSYKLASSLSLLHVSKWLHKGFRSDNILFFEREDGEVAVTEPFIAGFEYSRPEGQASVETRPTVDSDLALYYHPDIPLHGFNRVRDIYSLSVVLFEIAMWAPMSEKILEGGGRPAKDMTLFEIRAFLLDSLPVLGSQMGSSFRDAVYVCLTGDFGVPEDKDGAALARAFFAKVLKKLSYCRA